MNKHDEQADAPRVIYAQVCDSDDLEESEAEEGMESEMNEDSLIQEMPIRRKRKLPQDPLDTMALTRHFQLQKEFPPLYTGGAFFIHGANAYALNDGKVSVFDFRTAKPVYTLEEDNEEVICFAISPNQKYIATTNKSFMLRVYLL